MESKTKRPVTVTFGLTMLLLGGMLMSACPAQADPGYGVNGRQVRQQKRIGRGWQSGALTGREAYKIQKDQAQLARREARMRADGGGLSCKERDKLEHQQNKLSHDIYQQKHDGQSR